MCCKGAKVTRRKPCTRRRSRRLLWGLGVCVGVGAASGLVWVADAGYDWRLTHLGGLGLFRWRLWKSSKISSWPLRSAAGC